MLELAGIIILGIIAQWVAWRLKLPAILPLILIGLLVGPFSTLFSDDGTKWIEPIWNGVEGFFPGESLYYFVSLAISIILFEGGLTLKRSELRNIGPVITKLITIGSLVTFIGAGAVVVKEVLPYALVVGNPSKQIGWISEYGHRLNFDDQGIAICSESKEKYQLENNRVKKIDI